LILFIIQYCHTSIDTLLAVPYKLSMLKVDSEIYQYIE